MKMTIEIDCTPVEARAFFGLPDVTPLNQHMVDEMKRRLDANIALLEPSELLRSWMALGGQATEQFQKLMTAAAQNAMSGAMAGAGASPPRP
jgi:hypothetical protein